MLDMRVIVTKLRTAEPVFPNAGVEAAYRDRLQAIVLAMSKDMLARVRAAWAEASVPVVADTTPRKAAGVLFNYRGSVLLLHRTDGLGWALPGGGVEEGETYETAAVRECREEIKHTPRGELTLLDVQRGPVRYVTFYNEVEERFTPLLNSEHDNFIWVRPEIALTSLGLHPGVRATLEDMSRGDDAADHFATDAKAPRPSMAPLLRRALSKWSTLWVRRIEKVSTSIARDFAVQNKNATSASMLSKLSKAGFTVKFKPTPASTNALDAVIAENVGLIRSIPQKFLSDVEVQVWQTVMNGSDLDTLSRDIKVKYGVAWRRAALIAMDQNAKAKAAMERARRLEVGITQAIWMHSGGGVDPRDTHVKAGRDKVVYEVAKGWYDPAPRVEKFIWPGTEINCRCSDRAVIPGFD